MKKKKVTPVSLTQVDINVVYGEYPLNEIGMKGMEVEVDSPQKDEKTMTKRNMITWIVTLVVLVASIVLFSIALTQYLIANNEYERQVSSLENGILIDDNGRITYCTVYGLTKTSYDDLTSAVYQQDGKSATVSDENLSIISEKISKMSFTATNESYGVKTNSLTLNYENGKSITLTYYVESGIFEIDGNRYFATARNNYFDLQETVFMPILA